MAFKYVSNLHTDLVAIPRDYAMAASTTILKGDVCCLDSNGLLIPATNVISAKFVGVMASESTTTPAATYTVVKVIEDPLAVYEADTTHDNLQAYVGTSVDLTDAHTLNNDAVAVGVFRILEVVGALADRKVRGVFVKNAATL